MSNFVSTDAAVFRGTYADYCAAKWAGRTLDELRETQVNEHECWADHGYADWPKNFDATLAAEIARREAPMRAAAQARYDADIDDDIPF